MGVGWLGLAITVGKGVCFGGEQGSHSRQDLLFEEDGAGGIVGRDHECSSWSTAVIKYFEFCF